ncbi:hypothetical protein [Ralstonia sp. TCR112]|uniref:hypothetical protein n=1 Tax=Ralstonia sp. TCR112 TaxID=2601730 RepID=UPI00164C03B9|nr:hypothetical protein [Ralstonia sp. TCR112]
MRWVSALNLQQWSETIQAKNRLPGVVADLIRAVATDISDIRFPKDDKGQVRGFDGVLDAVGVPPYVPGGKSIWEFGASKDIETKANSDYDKRTEEIDPEVRKEITFVFVTPHTWDKPKKELSTWLEEKRSRKEWLSVELIDGPKLEDWFALCPAVAARFAKYDLQLLPATGVRSTDEFWEEFVTRFEPPLIEDVLLAGREGQANDLLRGLKQPRDRVAFAADTPDEVVAFAIAAIRKADLEVRKFLEAKTLVLDTAEAARAMSARSGHVFLPRGEARSFVGLLSRSGATVVSAGADEKRGSHTLLNRPHSSVLGHAFVGMGFSEQEGYDIARRCGRSLAVLARQRPSGTAETPEWVKDAEVLVPALLAGAWQSTRKFDKEALCLLADRVPYEQVEAPLRGLTKLRDSPIDHVGDIWSMRASVDAFVYLGHLIGQEHLDRFTNALTAVFSKALSAPVASDVYVSPSEREDTHSRWLRDGLMNTLLHMAVLHEQADFSVQGSTPQEFVDRTVKSLLGLTSDHRLMAALSDNLALLAEAAPVPFLDALERLLEGDATLIRPIFDEREEFFAPTSPHVGLLWALETLAWDSKLLHRVALCLARLAVVDPQGRLQNRPLRSLRSILLAWSPSTNASQPERQAVLRAVISEVHSIAWPLLEALLPRAYDTSDSAAQPKFREFGPLKNESLTYGEVWADQTYVVRLAVDYASGAPDRWQILIRAMSEFPAQIFTEFFVAIRTDLGEMQADARAQVVDALRKEVNRHRAYAGAEWALSEELLAQADEICREFKTDDPLEDITWLFDDWMPDIPGKGMDHGDPMVPVEAARLAAVRELYASSGIGGLAQLANRAKIKQSIVVALRSLELSQPPLFQLLESLLVTGSELDGVAGAILSEALARFGQGTIFDFQEAVIRLQIPAKRVAVLLMHLDDCQATWAIVDGFGSEISDAYWSERHPFFIKGTFEELNFAIERYEAHGRPFEAIQASGMRLRELPTSTLHRLLKATIAQINRAGAAVGTMTAHYIEQVFDVLEERDDVDRGALAQLEFAYLPLLDHRDKQLTLHRMLVERPEVFVEVICAVFKGENEEAKEISEAQQKLAMAGYRLLESLRILPGQREQEIDSDFLLTWCMQVRRLGAEAGRGAVTDGRIGHLLAHSPVSPTDNAWPHEAVRRAIEAISSDRLESGVAIARFNMRGVYSKAIGEGGDRERELARQARAWADRMQTSPRTAGMLRRIGDDWDAHARAEDIRAAKEALRE